MSRLSSQAKIVYYQMGVSGRPALAFTALASILICVVYVAVASGWQYVRPLLPYSDRPQAVSLVEVGKTYRSDFIDSVDQWVAFDAEEGVSYTILTEHTLADTVVTLYDSSAVPNFIDYNDDTDVGQTFLADYWSRLDWECDRSGRYFVRIETYDLWSERDQEDRFADLSVDAEASQSEYSLYGSHFEFRIAPLAPN